ncbi:MAG: immunity 22 family protein [Litorimonas sp.]
MPKQERTGHIWVGWSKNEDIFYDFFKETYSEDLEFPLNKFIQSQGGVWYDYDWVERIFHPNDPKLEKFFSYMNALYISDAETGRLKKMCEATEIDNLNASVVFFEDADVPDPQNIAEEKLRLNFLGEFKYAF